MISRAWYVQCDRCGDPAAVAVHGAQEARDFARQEGFIRVDGKDICVRCRDDAGAQHARMQVEARAQ